MSALPPVRRARFRRRAVAFAFLLLLAAAGCGNGDGCAGFISVNASPEECARIAERFGCASFDATGPSCGLRACARCDGIDSPS